MDEANEMAERFGQGATPDAKVTTAATLPDVSALGSNVHDPARQQWRSNREIDPSGANLAVHRAAIATKSQAAYTAIEGDLSSATAALRAQPANLAGAGTLIGQVRQTLAPFAETQSYNAFDAAAIILREGLEALLVIVALLAFLRPFQPGQ